MTAEELKHFILENQSKYWSESCVQINKGTLALVSARTSQTVLPENWVYIGDCVSDSGNFDDEKLAMAAHEITLLSKHY